MIVASLYEIEGIQLPGDTRDILELTGERTGKGFEFRAQGFDLSDTWASVKVARGDMPDHLVLYHPGHKEHLPYLIAHECGHVLRLYGVPEEERRLPSVNRAHRRNIVYAIGNDIEKFHRIGLSPDHLSQLVTMWHGGIIRQLTNMPVDMRIERWLYEEHPGLREYQVPALIEQLRENFQVLSSQVKELTPRKVYEASNGLNAAYARYLSLMLAEDGHYSPYVGTPFERVGRELGDYQWMTTDLGYKGDVQAINRWSRYFGTIGWWEWRRIK